MATVKQITAEYKEFISREVIDQFGGSYQTYETLGKVWRQKMKYNPAQEEFLIRRTKLFLNVQDKSVQNNMNQMFRISCNIADYLSKYLVKKSSLLTRKNVANKVVKTVFLDDDRFNMKFRNLYKDPIDLTNEKYVASNPGVVAMYIANQEKSK